MVLSITDITTSDRIPIRLRFMTSSLGSLQWNQTEFVTEARLRYRWKLAVTPRDIACFVPSPTELPHGSFLLVLQQHESGLHHWNSPQAGHVVVERLPAGSFLVPQAEFDSADVSSPVSATLNNRRMS